MTDVNNEVLVVEHSKLGASGAPRWMPCPGSVQLIENLRSALSGKELEDFDRPGVAASEGSAAHHVAARCLNEDKDAWEFAGEEILSDGLWFTVDDEMVAGIQTYVDLVKSKLEQHAEAGAKLYVESPLSSVLDDEAYGTGDTVIYVPDDRIIVIDFKYGKGVVVEPTCEQLREYGYLACEMFDSDNIKVVELFVCQPRIPHPKGKSRLSVDSKPALERWFTTEVLPAMAATRQESPVLVTGEQCRFCPANDQCPALKKEVLNFDATLDPAHFSTEEAATIKKKGSAIIKFLGKVDELLLKRAMKGEDIPGQKLVRKRANRVFKDGAEDALMKNFGKDAYNEPTLKTPPNVEKLTGGKKFVAKWAYSPQGGLTLADESDKRDAVRLDGEEFFGDPD